jgi:hypothetical protein
MKTTFIVKAASSVLAFAMLALFLVPIGFAYKMDASGSNPSSVKSCNSKPSTFTVFPYAKLNTDQNGSVLNLEFHVSSLDGNCTAKIYASDNNGYTTTSDNVQEDNKLKIALR